MKEIEGKKIACNRFCPHCGKQGNWKKYEFFEKGYKFFCRCDCGSESGWLNADMEPTEPHVSFLRFVESKAKEINNLKFRGY